MFGLGKVPKIPGTFGSLATVIILYIFFHILNLSSNIILILLVIIFIYAFSAVTSYIKDNENKDPKEVIIDEFIGQSIPIYLYEISHGTIKSSDEALIFYGVCFILFRFFDIAKPFPVNYFDKNYQYRRRCHCRKPSLQNHYQHQIYSHLRQFVTVFQHHYYWLM